ncbi:phasin family protein [Bradyrhizobium lablabi]|nr:phasin family protein [Bradyrhizobium lablabi]
MPDQQAAREFVDAVVASADTAPAGIAATAEAAPAEPPVVEAPPVVESRPVAEVPRVAEAPLVAKAPRLAEAAAPETPPAAAKTETTTPVGLQTIASAYRDYTRKSLEDAQSYVEKLSSVRSLDKAMEVQTEFAKQAYETFAADSRKIRDLYGEFFKQSMRLPMLPFERRRDR